MLYGQIQISPSDWLDWKKGFVTQQVLAALTQERDEWAARLYDGQTIDNPGREVVETAKAVGVLYGLDCLLVGLQELLTDQWKERSEQG